jgi:Domain of unknown function (DUF4852)
MKLILLVLTSLFLITGCETTGSLADVAKNFQDTIKNSINISKGDSDTGGKIIDISLGATAKQAVAGQAKSTVVLEKVGSNINPLSAVVLDGFLADSYLIHYAQSNNPIDIKEYLLKAQTNLSTSYALADSFTRKDIEDKALPIVQAQIKAIKNASFIVYKSAGENRISPYDFDKEGFLIERGGSYIESLFFSISNRYKKTWATYKNKDDAQLIEKIRSQGKINRPFVFYRVKSTEKEKGLQPILYVEHVAFVAYDEKGSRFFAIFDKVTDREKSFILDTNWFTSAPR